MNKKVYEKFWRYVDYFKTGQANYIAFGLGITNFILLIYNFVVEKYGLFPNIGLLEFGTIVFTLLICAGTIIGFVHYRSQAYKQGREVMWDNDPRGSGLIENVKIIKKDLEVIKGKLR